MTLGRIDTSKIASDTLTVPNVYDDQYAFQIDKVFFMGAPLSDHSLVALLDMSSDHIQLPQRLFDKLMSQHNDRYLLQEFQQADSPGCKNYERCLSSPKPCHTYWSKFTQDFTL